MIYSIFLNQGVLGSLSWTNADTGTTSDCSERPGKASCLVHQHHRVPRLSHGLGTVDDINPASPDVYHNTITSRVVVYEVMPDFNHQT